MMKQPKILRRTHAHCCWAARPRLSLLERQLSHDACRIARRQTIRRNILCHYRASRNDCSSTDGYTAQNKCPRAYPSVVLDLYGSLTQRYVTRMTSFCYFPKLRMPLGSSYWMRKIVENVDGMSDKHAISDSNRAGRPNARLFADVAPVSH